MVEPLTLSASIAVTETAQEVGKETFRQFIEVSKKAAEWNGGQELQPSASTIERLNLLLDQEKYRKLNEFRETSQLSPEVIGQAYKDINLKGQMGESLMEAKLSQYGDVQSQIPVQVEGAVNRNIVDLRLTESSHSLKQVEMNVMDGQIQIENNYDLMSGESASFEVKNGGYPYFRQEVLSGDLLQQIEAGKQISDHSFVVINEDTAKELLRNPTQTAEMILKIQDSGGKLMVGLPSQAIQMAIFI